MSIARFWTLLGNELRDKALLTAHFAKGGGMFRKKSAMSNSAKMSPARTVMCKNLLSASRLLEQIPGGFAQNG